MLYSYTIITPANTPATAKKITPLKLCRGVLHKIYIIFPPGPQGYLHLQISHSAHQIFPTNAEENFALDSAIIESPEHYELNQPPFNLTAQTWNTDDTLEHRVIVIVGILEKKYIVPVLPSWIDRLKFLIGA